MQIGLRISRINEDSDIVEFAVSAWNGTFGGATELYLGHGDLERTAENLRNFPTRPSDTRIVELGTFDPKSAGGGARFCFQVLDRAGHVGLDATLRSEGVALQTEQQVHLFANIEPAAIYRFLEELVKVSASNLHEAILDFDGAINRS